MDGNVRIARFGIGQVVRHRLFPFRGIIFDIDPEFANTLAPLGKAYHELR